MGFKSRVAPEGFTIGLAPLSPNADELASLHLLIYRNWLSPTWRRHIKHVPRTSHTNALGNAEHWLEQALEANQLKRSDVALSFDPKVAKEYRLSQVAMRHWLKLAFAQLLHSRPDFPGWVQAFGYKLIGPDENVAHIASTAQDHPIIEVGKRPWIVAAIHGNPKAMVFDRDVGPQSVDELDSDDHGRLKAAATSGRCECFFCRSVRHD
jgi:hypothetical protein